MTDKNSNIALNAEDWTHVRNTIRMMHLAICQVQISLTDSARSMDSLTESFTEIAKYTEELNVPSPIQATAAKMHEHVSEAILSFQFYDRLTQRLDHVCKGLEDTVEIMGDDERVHLQESWESILLELKATYSMESERIMFEQIERGASVKEALETYRHHFDAEDRSSDTSGTDDEVELF